MKLAMSPMRSYDTFEETRALTIRVMLFTCFGRRKAENAISSVSK